mmetsp:Transcript_24230/g.42892  ORF Transcript_24230/g.42892 Transcript_24230/m.42892 type:complete len:290 (-) Transcript_24230:484-1353(-)
MAFLANPRVVGRLGVCVDFVLPPAGEDLYRAVAENDRVPSKVDRRQVRAAPEGLHLELYNRFMLAHVIVTSGERALQHDSRSQRVGEFVHILGPRPLPIVGAVDPLILDEFREFSTVVVHPLAGLEHFRRFRRALGEVAALDEVWPRTVGRNGLVVKQLSREDFIVIPVAVDLGGSELVSMEEAVHLALVLFDFEVVFALILVHVRHGLGPQRDHLVPTLIDTIDTLGLAPIGVQLELPRCLLEQRPLRLVVVLGLEPRRMSTRRYVRPKMQVELRLGDEPRDISHFFH